MVAAFAIELSLKLFYMAYAPNAPKRKHDLHDLFLGLHPTIQADIRATFEGNLREHPNVPLLAFRTSPTMPDPPSEVPAGLPFATADGLLEQCSKLFVQARYFPEQVGDAWVMISHPLSYLLHMIDSLRVVFDAYLQNGWRHRDAN
ncbi:hypothetical protein [Sphingosinicella sp. LY1275]|uniref:hypothetical protein n=1 Tax=Sphingosinicella sp. LY1275 TaxID=3095379 RepID=UPI002ADEE505|nr:hypothetical protein [Sphingosinicella sp. LY1275]MEA1013734.1 hypothetical protein [Sphingosinicella sp. LY1275]